MTFWKLITLKEIISFFNASAKRLLVLKNIFTKQLTELCQTRWVEIHDGVLQFKSTLSKVNIFYEVKLYVIYI